MKYVNGPNNGQEVVTGLDINLYPDQSISFDTGPVTVVTDGKILRQERSAPLYLLGDTSGTPIPISTLIPTGTGKSVILIVGPNQDVVTLNIQVVSPVPPLKVIRAAGDTPQTGLSTNPQQTPPPAAVIPTSAGSTTPTLTTRIEVYGYNQNITVLDSGDYIFRDGISRNSWGTGQYEGQTIYLHADWEGPGGVKWLGGTIVIEDWVFDEAGWQAIRKISEKTQWQHCLYGNKRAPGKRFILNRCTFARPASIGTKLMGDAEVNDPIYYLCAIGVQSLYGTVTINNPIFYRPSYHAVAVAKSAAKPSGVELVGKCAVDAYTNTTLNNPLFMGGQDDERLNIPANDPKPYNVGMISLNAVHDHYKDAPGAAVTVTGNARAYGWAPKSGTQSLYNGNLNRLTGTLISSLAPRPAMVNYNPQPLFDSLYAGKISRADFNKEFRRQLLALEA